LHRISASRSRGVAVEDGGSERKLVVRRELQTHARRGFRIGRAAARQILGGENRPPECGVDEEVGVLAHQEFLRGRELTDAQAGLGSEFLLDPKVEQPRRGRRLDPADRHQIIEIIGAELRSVDLVKAGVKGRPGPAGELLEIRVDDRAETAIVSEALRHAARGISESVAIVREGELQSGLLQPRAQPARIGQLAQGFGQGRRGEVGRGRCAALVVRRVAGRHGRILGQCDDGYGDDEASCNTAAKLCDLHATGSNRAVKP
jgi:hypothetical protein